MSKCEDCMFYKKIDYDTGYCHRYPPVGNRYEKRFEDSGNQKVPILNMTFNNNWCGEHKDKSCLK